MTNWKWYGNAGHLAVSHQCRFHLSTEVGNYLVSTIGEWYPARSKEMDTIGTGSKDFYETYVFKLDGTRCKCGCGLPGIHLSEIAGLRYETPKEANEGHIKFCEEYENNIE